LFLIKLPYKRETDLIYLEITSIISLISIYQNNTCPGVNFNLIIQIFLAVCQHSGVSWGILDWAVSCTSTYRNKVPHTVETRASAQIIRKQDGNGAYRQQTTQYPLVHKPPLQVSFVVVTAGLIGFICAGDEQYNYVISCADGRRQSQQN
jgi:hypothetical protein